MLLNLKENHPMIANRTIALLSTLVFTCLALPAEAADRMRTGQWVGTTTFNSRTINTSNCVTPGEADAMNGDAKSIRTNLEKAIPPEICKLTDIKVTGGQVIYTSTCKVGAPTVVTTNYHGDSFESTSSSGTKSAAKLVGACK